MIRSALRVVALLAIFAGPVTAQTPATPQLPAEHIRGKVKTLDAERLVVATREGRTAIVALTKDWVVVLMKPVDASAIKPGSFIGATEVETPGGGESLEIHILPPGARIGEGRYPWDLKPGTTMTCGVVLHAVAGPKGRELDVEYPGGTRHIFVSPAAPVVETVPGDRLLLKPGASVFIAPMRTPDGGWAATRILVGEKGEAPPM